MDALGDVGCQAPAVNNPACTSADRAYLTSALTVAEQALAKADGLNRDEALSRKTVAIFEHARGYGRLYEGLNAKPFLRRREAVERAALALFEQHHKRS